MHGRNHQWFQRIAYNPKGDIVATGTGSSGSLLTLWDALIGNPLHTILTSTDFNCQVNATSIRYPFQDSCNIFSRFYKQNIPNCATFYLPRQALFCIICETTYNTFYDIEFFMYTPH